MSPATIDRQLAPIKKARYPEATSTPRRGLILRSSILLWTCMDGFRDHLDMRQGATSWGLPCRILNQ